MRRLLIAAFVSSVLFAGCIAAGGDGGSVDSVASADGPVAVRGGRGEDGTWRAGRDGCDVRAADDWVEMCGVRFGLAPGRMTVRSVSGDLRWSDLRVAVDVKGVQARLDGHALSLDTPTRLDKERFGSSPSVMMSASPFAGDPRVGQALSLCGPDQAYVWFWDERPIGASLEFVWPLPPC